MRRLGTNEEGLTIYSETLHADTCIVRAVDSTGITQWELIMPREKCEALVTTLNP